jgi:hypothetical protein
LTTNAVTALARPLDGGPTRSISPWSIGLRTGVAVALGVGD